jgi:hypothetical protein
VVADLPSIRVNCPQRFTVSRAEQRDSISSTNPDQRVRAESLRRWSPIDFQP